MDRRLCVSLMAATFVGVGVMSGLASAVQAQAVRVGGSADFDACGSVGVPTGLNPRGDNFLAVRAGATSRATMRDKLRPGQRFYICGQRGGWVAIVYSKRRGADCGVSSPIARRQAYRGPCRSGWVYRKFVGDFAG